MSHINGPVSVCLSEFMDFSGNTSRKPPVEPPVFTGLSNTLLNCPINKCTCSALALQSKCHFFHPLSNVREVGHLEWTSGREGRVCEVS